MHIQSKCNGNRSQESLCFMINNARYNKYISLRYLQSNLASPRHVGLFNFDWDSPCMLNDQEHVIDVLGVLN
jgi:hypothetical protein